MRNAYWDYFKYLVRGLPVPSDAQFEFLKNGMLVYDIGANLGNYSALFLDKGCRVIALEPQEYCYRFLKLRFRGNKNICLLKKGAGSIPESRDLFISTSHTLSSMNKKWIDGVSQTERFKESAPEWKEKSTVELVTLDSLILQYGIPDYIKIDVEGFEEETLKGLTRSVKYISFEYTFPEFTQEAVNCIKKISCIGKYHFQSQKSGQMITADELINEIEDLSQNRELHNGDIHAQLISE